MLCIPLWFPYHCPMTFDTVTPGCSRPCHQCAVSLFSSPCCAPSLLLMLGSCLHLSLLYWCFLTQLLGFLPCVAW